VTSYCGGEWLSGSGHENAIVQAGGTGAGGTQIALFGSQLVPAPHAQADVAPAAVLSVNVIPTVRGQHGGSSVRLFDSAVKLWPEQVGAATTTPELMMVLTTTVAPGGVKVTSLEQQSPNRFTRQCSNCSRCPADHRDLLPCRTCRPRSPPGRIARRNWCPPSG